MIRSLPVLAAALLAVALSPASRAEPPAPAVIDPGAPPGTGGDRPAPRVDGEQRMSYGPFGEVVIYRPKGTVKSVALFVSGDGGWNMGVVEMGRHLVEMDAAVVGIDIRRYIKAINAPTQSCRSYAVDFEGLSHAVQQRLKLPEYLPPVLVGYSSGATLVYAAAVQSPKGTFAGALSMGFCPDLQLTQKACKGSGLEYEWQYAKHGNPPPVVGLVYAASATNMTPWVAFQGAADKVCDSPATREFAGKIPFGGGLLPKAAIAYAGTWVAGASLERLYRVGYGLTRVERKRAWDEAFTRGKQVAAQLMARVKHPKGSKPEPVEAPPHLEDSVA